MTMALISVNIKTHSGVKILEPGTSNILQKNVNIFGKYFLTKTPIHFKVTLPRFIQFQDHIKISETFHFDLYSKELFGLKNEFKFLLANTQEETFFDIKKKRKEKFLANFIPSLRFFLLVHFGADILPVLPQNSPPNVSDIKPFLVSVEAKMVK
ncbi:hypothetical protein Bhyg_15373 [Pseudolycoriella hygida]|uniref:Uncharacterized protein n=1 Tax=Pseudolycoriella hygida TaxID=35572 RepID=A0A9Q0RYD9_9DIPT|nr:hypothetical protein Bhyg_15373 [Pseudolycoriella hygida]